MTSNEFPANSARATLLSLVLSLSEEEAAEALEALEEAGVGTVGSV